MPDERPPRRAAVICRHPATQRAVAQALGVAGLGLRQVVAPSLLPRSQPGEFEVLVLDLDIDPQAPSAALVEAVGAHCPGTPVVCVAGLNTKQRLIESLEHPAVMALVPKQGSWLESPTAPAAAKNEGPDEQELAIALRRLTAGAVIPQGPVPYLIGNSPVEEHLIASTAEKNDALQSLLALGQRLGLSDEKTRRIELAADELLLNAFYDAPRNAEGEPRYGPASRSAGDRREPITLSAKEQVRLRFGTDGRSFAISVHDKFGTFTRDAVVAHIGRMLELGGPRPRSVDSSLTGGAGLGLVLTFGAASQLIIHAADGRFTEVTAVVHIAGSNRAAMVRGSSLYLFL